MNLLIKLNIILSRDTLVYLVCGLSLEVAHFIL